MDQRRRGATSNGLAWERVYRSIREAITSGYFREGERLTESFIAEQLQTSRTPAREALHRLAAEGYLLLEPNRGARVRALTQAEVEEILFVREVLERACVRLATERADADDLEQLAQCLTRMEEAGNRHDSERVHAAGSQFHAMIAAAARNRELLSILKQLQTKISRVSHAALTRPERVLAAVEEHWEIYRAIVARDPDAAEQAMTGHIQQSWKSANEAVYGEQVRPRTLADIARRLTD